MLSKVLAVVMAVGVLTVGGYAYWQYTDGGPCCGMVPTAQQTVADEPGCCHEVSRSSLSSGSVAPCCSESSPAGDAEVLAIPPREVK